jgi:hypothetical protein
MSFSQSLRCRPMVGSSSRYRLRGSSPRLRSLVGGEAGGEFGDQLEALGLAAGEGGRTLAEREVAQAAIDHERQTWESWEWKSKNSAASSKVSSRTWPMFLPFQVMSASSGP